MVNGRKLNDCLAILSLWLLFGEKFPLFTSELTNQHAGKALFTSGCVVYINDLY